MAYVASLAFFVTLGGISIGHYLNDMVPPSKVTGLCWCTHHFLFLRVMAYVSAVLPINAFNGLTWRSS